MIKYFLAACCFITFGNLYAQVTLLEETFETNANVWTSYGTSSPNYWVRALTAGNGSTVAGINAMYITSNLANDYVYENAPTGTTQSAILAHEVVANCMGTLSFRFDHLLNPSDPADFAQLVYSTDAGATWQSFGANLSNGNAWVQNTVSLPANLEGNTFLLGFRFTYNDADNFGIPLAIDNVKVTGIDLSGNVVICPQNQTVYSNALCETTLEDYTDNIVSTTACTGVPIMTYTQSPAAGTTLNQTTTITITGNEPGGNTGSCSFQLSLIDTIKPTISCDVELIVPITSNCQITVPNLVTTAVVADNCTATNALTVTQNPVATATFTGITNVYITVQDAAGNQRVCATRLIPDDTQAPVITCPADIIIDNGSNCSFIIPDYSTATVVTDNCPTYTLTQSLAFGTSISTGFYPITMTATDEAGNTGQCVFNLTVTENVAPQITFCPQNITTCNPTVSYSAVLASDNCLVYVLQTDASGLTSGDNFPVGITPQSYTAYDSTGNQATCNFTVEVLLYPSQATIADETIDLCNQTNVNLTADVPAQGTGMWVVSQGTGVLATPSSATTAVSNLVTGSNIFSWVVSTPQCGSTNDQVTVVNNALPTTVNILSDTSYICNATSTLLLGTFPTVGTGVWTTTSGTTIASPTNHNTNASNFDAGWNNFTFTITNGNCPSSSDSIAIFTSVQAQIFSNDTTICFENDQIAISGNEPGFSQEAGWYFYQGNANIEDPYASNTLVNDFTATTNYLIYSFKHPLCPKTMDTMTIIVNNCESDDLIIPSIFSPNADGKNDIFMVVNLHEFYPECEVSIVNRWGSLIYDSKGYATPWDGTHKGNELPMGVYYYKIQLNNESKQVYTGPITLIR